MPHQPGLVSCNILVTLADNPDPHAIFYCQHSIPNGPQFYTKLYPGTDKSTYTDTVQLTTVYQSAYAVSNSMVDTILRHNYNMRILEDV